MGRAQKLLSEETVTEIWRRQLVASSKLVTSQGLAVAVIYPGDIAPSCGPDFHQAIVCFGKGKPVRGDIEVHIRASEWQIHKHHLNPAYNGVILHVVLWDDSQTPTPLENGASAQVVELAHRLSSPMEQLCQQLLIPWTAEEPCFRAAKLLPADTLASLLDAAGEERFRLKAALMGKALASKGAEQTLYENVMVALGYSRNKQSFLKLAQSLPLRVLTSIASSEPPATGIQRLQALLLGAAGLLPGQGYCQCSADEKRLLAELERLWSEMGIKPTMSQSEWYLSGIRPGNSPVRRLAAASHLVYRYLERGWLQGVLELVARATVSREGHKAIEKGFWVAADICRAGSAHPGSGRFKTPPALLGADRAAEIVVNMVLPFCFAWAQASQQVELAKKALTLYQSHTPNQENRVIKPMLQRIWQAKTSPLVNTAARQQGLIHLYQSYCVDRNCAFCPLGSRANPA